MSRPKKKLDSETLKKAEQAFDNLKESEIALKLLAIISYGYNPVQLVSKTFRTKERNIFRWLENFKTKGIEGLKPQSKGHRAALLNDEYKKQIEEWIIKGQNSQKKKIHWTLEKLSKAIESHYGIKIKKSALANNLKNLDIVLKKPRPVHYLADKEKQEDFKKN